MKTTTRNDAATTRRGAVLERIAQMILGIDTLQTRNSDGLDFSDQAVWTLKRALEAADLAGAGDELADSINR